MEWALLAEKCEMHTLLAHCKVSMIQETDAFWSNPAENALQLSGASMLRMLKAAAYNNTQCSISQCTSVQDLTA